MKSFIMSVYEYTILTIQLLSVLTVGIFIIYVTCYH